MRRFIAPVVIALITVAGLGVESATAGNGCPAGQVRIHGVCQLPRHHHRCPAGQVFAGGKCRLP